MKILLIEPGIERSVSVPDATEVVSLGVKQDSQSFLKGVKTIPIVPTPQFETHTYKSGKELRRERRKNNRKLNLK